MATRTVLSPKSSKSGSSKFGSSKTASKSGTGNFTRMLAAETVPESGLDADVRASDSECVALAEACGLAAVHDFVVDFSVRKLDRTSFKVMGKLRARVTQTCVVSLEPFETLVRAEIDVDFAPPSGSPAAAFHGEDPPDPIIGGKIDLGALAVEFLVLNLDVHPRKPGVYFEGTGVFGEPSEKNSPFSVLRQR